MNKKRYIFASVTGTDTGCGGISFCMLLILKNPLFIRYMLMNIKYQTKIIKLFIMLRYKGVCMAEVSVKYPRFFPVSSWLYPYTV